MRFKKTYFVLMLTFLVLIASNVALASDKHIIFATDTDPVTMDPHKSNDGPSMIVWNQVYDTLLFVDVESRELIPGLAESWESVDEYTTRFNIRQGVRFHDGSLLTAEDVAFSINRLIAPETRSPAAFLLSMVEEIKVEDEYSVLVTTEEPFAPLLFHFTHLTTSILPKALVEEKGDDFARHPIGTGPFQFSNYIRGDRVELEKYADYWRQEPVPERVTIRIIPEPATQVAELEAGGIQIAFNVPTVEVDFLAAQPDIEIYSTVGWGIFCLTFNMEREPFDDVRVRKAFNHALDRELIVDFVYHGLAMPAAQISSPIVFGHNPDLEPATYDPDLSRQLLAEAGFADGLETSILVWSMEQYVRLAEAMQGMLSDVGINARLDVVEFGAGLDLQYAGDFYTTIRGWGCPTLDSDYNLHALYHSDSFPPGSNWGSYQNDEVDELIIYARTTSDIAERERAYHRVMEILQAESPSAYIIHNLTAFAKRVELKDTVIPFSPIHLNLLNSYID